MACYWTEFHNMSPANQHKNSFYSLDEYFQLLKTKGE